MEDTKEQRLDRFNARVLDIAFRYLREDPVLEREVALLFLGKELGIKIRLPDRNAPIPYSDLPVELQDWLDEHPKEKDAYMRMLLGLEEPEVEPRLEERVVEGIKDKAVEDIVSSFGNQNSDWEVPVRELLRTNDLPDIIESLFKLRSGSTSAADDQNRSDPGDSQATGTVTPVPITGFMPTGFGSN